MTVCCLFLWNGLQNKTNRDKLFKMISKESQKKKSQAKCKKIFLKSSFKKLSLKALLKKFPTKLFYKAFSKSFSVLLFESKVGPIRNILLITCNTWIPVFCGVIDFWQSSTIVFRQVFNWNVLMELLHVIAMEIHLKQKKMTKNSFWKIASRL